jgi:hypothetical protein
MLRTHPLPVPSAVTRSPDELGIAVVDVDVVLAVAVELNGAEPAVARAVEAPTFGEMAVVEVLDVVVARRPRSSVHPSAPFSRASRSPLLCAALRPPLALIRTRRALIRTRPPDKTIGTRQEPCSSTVRQRRLTGA